MLTLDGRSWRFHGHAIVSADDRIADQTGRTPASLRNEADWSRFQAALDRAAVTVLGRRGHEANPNPRRRNRLVLSSRADGVERRPDAWWWNPAAASLADALLAAAPAGGVVAIPGGMQVFDLFLEEGYDEFHLARAEKVLILDGRPIFSAVSGGMTAAAALASHGLEPRETVTLDPLARVSLTLWARSGTRDTPPAPA